MPRARHVSVSPPEWLHHWNGRSWSATALPAELGHTITTAGATGPRNVWAFAGGDEEGDSYAIRWDGRRWKVAQRRPGGTMVSDSAVLSASTVASDDIWAVGSDNFGIDNMLARWDGHTGTQLGVPGLPNEENHFPELRGIYAASPQDVWIVGDEYQSDGDDSSRTPIAAHGASADGPCASPTQPARRPVAGGKRVGRDGVRAVSLHAIVNRARR